MSDFLNDLNNSQREAVTYIDGPSLVIAGAGSGKTRVLTCKIAYLLQQGWHPSSILALTFTNKAAREMRERIATLVEPELAARLWMGTFHSVFYRILRTEAEAIGFKPSFTIYDTSDSKSLIKNILKDKALDEKQYKPSSVLAVISRAKNRLVRPEDYARSTQCLRADATMNMPRVAEVYQEYCDRCRQSNVMDFDDLLLYTYLLFRDHPDICERYRNRFAYLLVDEYQDTNYAQHAIIWQLAGGHQHICVVGDDAQSIYSFRGAEIENILGFTKQYDQARIFKLEQNYRSTQVIVNAANSLIKHNRRQIAKDVYSMNEHGEPVQVISAYSDLEEGELVAARISQLVRSREMSYSDFAILYRTNAQSRIFEEAFRKKGMPYRIYGGLSFYQRKEIKDIIAYFRVLVNPDDEEAMKRIINYPARGIGQTTLEKVRRAAREAEVSLWEVLCNLSDYLPSLTKGTAGKLLAFRGFIESYQERVSKENAYVLAESMIKESGIARELTRSMDPEDLARRENVEELLNGMQAFVEQRLEEGSSNYLLADFLQEVSLMSDTEEDDEEGDDKITLMTVHAAKGLEFRVVFVVGLEENLFPSALSLESPREMEEERRLFYVALTRAEELCFLSYAGNRYRYGKMEFSNPSRFLYEIDPACVKGLSGGGARYRRETDDTNSRPLASVSRMVPKTSPLRPVTHMRPVTSAVSAPSASSAVLPASASAALSGDTGGLRVGQTIEHERFGRGTIQAIEGSGENLKATVVFNTMGTKQLLLKFARFKVVD